MPRTSDFTGSRCAAYATRMLLVAMLLIPHAPGFTQDSRLEVGPWAAQLGRGDLHELSWQGDEIVQRGAVRGYLPE